MAALAAVLPTVSTVAQTTISELEPAVFESSPLAPGETGINRVWTAREGDALDRLRGQTLGDTLATEPGVSQSYYGPAASRPVVRGLEGQRVRVLQNGLDTFDVSAESVDHAVAVDPLLIDRVEILRGSSALLYGANAIGGVVNTIDRSIPRSAPENGLEGRARAAYSTVNDGREGGAVVFTGSDNLVLQAHGIFRETRDYDTPAFTLEDGSRVDTVANSHARTWDAGLGASILLETGFIGFGFSQFDSTYGVPNEEAPTIDLERSRFEARGVISPEGPNWLTELRGSFAFGDYRHDEVEQSGEIAATFLREGFEGRLEALHTFGDVSGVAGFQGNVDDLRVSGEENVFAGASGNNPAIESDETRRLAFFLMEKYTVNDRLAVDVGGRVETVRHDYTGAPDHDGTALSATTGLSVRPLADWSLGVNLAFTERLPIAAELLSDGPHLATGGFEIGDPGLGKETATGIEVVIRRTSGAVTGHVGVFYTAFDDYIFLADTGLMRDPEGNDPAITGEESLAERIYTAVDTEFYGLEAELDWEAGQVGPFAITLSGFGDYLRARNTDANENLPRIAPMRLGAGFTLHNETTTFGLKVVRTFTQNDTAPGEASTAGHTLISAHMDYTIPTRSADFEIYAKATNLTDDLARVHTSFLRDTAPLPGASLEAGIRVSF